MHIGAPVWVFQWEPPYEDAVRRIAKCGFTSVELIAWNRETLETYYTADRIAELRRIMYDEGLQLSEFVSTPRNMASSDRKLHAQAVEHFRKAVEVAVALGTEIINTVSAIPFSLPVPHLLVRPRLQHVTLKCPPNAATRKHGRTTTKRTSIWSSVFVPSAKMQDCATHLSHIRIAM